MSDFYTIVFALFAYDVAKVMLTVAINLGALVLAARKG